MANFGKIYESSWWGEGVCANTVGWGSSYKSIANCSDASFSYAEASYAKNGTDPTPTITGDAGGTFTATPAGLSINSSTGEITLSTSTINSYTVKYTLPDGTTGSLNAAEYAKRDQELKDKGAKFDFSEFSKVIDGKKYKCRLMTGGNDFYDENNGLSGGLPADNEWDRFISGGETIKGLPSLSSNDKIGVLSDEVLQAPHNQFWNWAGAYSWTSMPYLNRDNARCCRERNIRYLRKCRRCKANSYCNRKSRVWLVRDSLLRCHISVSWPRFKDSQ